MQLQRTVLIIDPLPDERQMYVNLLHLDNMRALCASDLTEAHNIIRHNRTDLILLDLFLQPSEWLRVPESLKQAESSLPPVLGIVTIADLAKQAADAGYFGCHDEASLGRSPSSGCSGYR